MIIIIEYNKGLVNSISDIKTQIETIENDYNNSLQDKINQIDYLSRQLSVYQNQNLELYKNLATIQKNIEEEKVNENNLQNKNKSQSKNQNINLSNNQSINLSKNQSIIKSKNKMSIQENKKEDDPKENNMIIDNINSGKIDLFNDNKIDMNVYNKINLESIKNEKNIQLQNLIKPMFPNDEVYQKEFTPDKIYTIKNPN